MSMEVINTFGYIFKRLLKNFNIKIVHFSSLNFENDKQNNMNLLPESRLLKTRPASGCIANIRNKSKIGKS